MNTKRLITLAVGCTLLAAPAFLAAQQDQEHGQNQESVADAARKAQAAKKDAPKAKLTIDNDNLGTLTGQVNVVGEEPPVEEKKPGTEEKAAKGPAKDEAYWRGRFADAYKKLADDEHELDILQREYNLKQEQFYTDPMAQLKQEYSRQDLNDQKAKIDAKKQAVDQDKADISNLQDELRQAGGDAGWGNPPAQSSSSDSGSSGSSGSTPESAPASTTSQP
jgi:hypothetical protein